MICYALAMICNYELYLINYAYGKNIMHQIRSVDTTDEILRELGARLRGYRLQQNVTTAELATRAGIGVATAARAETGRNTSVETIVKILRALGRLDALDAILPEPLVSPIQLAARRGRQRRRARPRRVGSSIPALGQQPALPAPQHAEPRHR